MNSQEANLNSLLERIGFRRDKVASEDDVLVVYNSIATHSSNLCDIGKIDYILEIGTKLGDNAVINLIKEKTDELDRRIMSGVRNSMLHSQKTD